MSNMCMVIYVRMILDNNGNLVVCDCSKDGSRF